MPCAWPDVLGSIQAAGDGDETNIIVATVEEDGIPKVRGGGPGRVASDAPSEPERHGEVATGREPTPHPPTPREAYTYCVSFPKCLLRLR